MKIVITLFLFISIMFADMLIQSGKDLANGQQSMNPIADHTIKGRVLAWYFVDEEDVPDYWVLELDVNNDGVRDKFLVINPASVQDDENAILTAAVPTNDWVTVTIRSNQTVHMWDLVGVR